LKLGVSLGSSDSEVAETIKEIKRTDSNRTMIMLSNNIDEKSDAPIDNNLYIVDHARLLANDLQENEFEIDEDILNLTLAEIKKNRKIKKIIRSKLVVVHRIFGLKK
jgi:hypothetical protein